jgi:RNA-directed DNA polymerase
LHGGTSYVSCLVVGFEHDANANRFLDARHARFEEFVVSLHPDKTRLIEFGRHATANRVSRGLKPDTFDFLGLTFISGKSLSHRKSRCDRVQAKFTEIKVELRPRMHDPIRETAEWLKQVVTGYFQYHAVPTNGPAHGAFRHHVIDLRRRGQKHEMTWPRIGKLADDWLPKPRILHP